MGETTTKIDPQSKDQYDSVGNASHYDNDRIASIVKVERIWGTYEAMVFCEINSFKYKERLGDKVGQSIDQELKKAKWYQKMASILKAKIGTDKEIKAPSEQECKNPLK